MTNAFVQRLLTITAVTTIAVLAGCRGGISESPPIHPVLDMDFQTKVKAQMKVEFDGFSDHRGMRKPVAGTVARGSLAMSENDVWKNGDSYVANPIEPTMQVVRRGQERFNIYCAVCHDRSGSGKGLVLQRANQGAFNAVVPDLGKEPRLLEQADGYFYEVIRNGFGTMPAYGHQIPVEDRWAIVHYLRALQNRYE